MSLAAGARNRRLRLQRAIITRDALNQPMATWTTVATLWAFKQDISDGEQVRAAEVGAQITTRFQILYTSLSKTLTPQDRCACEGLTYDIKAVKEIGFHEGIEITAMARIDLNG